MAALDFNTALSRLVGLSDRLGHRRPYKKILPKVFTGRLTLSATNGVVTPFIPSSFSNDAPYPFVLEQVQVRNLTSASFWLLRLTDKEGFNLFGDRVESDVRSLLGYGAPGPDIAENGIDNGPLVLIPSHYRAEPGGGFLADARSVGTATVTTLNLKGYWILEE